MYDQTKHSSTPSKYAPGPSSKTGYGAVRDEYTGMVSSPVSKYDTGSSNRYERQVKEVRYGTSVEGREFRFDTTGYGATKADVEYSFSQQEARENRHVYKESLPRAQESNYSSTYSYPVAGSVNNNLGSQVKSSRVIV